MVPNIQTLIPRDNKTHVAHGTLKRRPNPTCSDKSVTNSDQPQHRERKENIRVGKKRRKLFASIIKIY